MAKIRPELKATLLKEMWTQTPSSSFWRTRLRFLFGLSFGLIAPLLFAEIFVRLRPPSDIQPWLGEQSPLTGIYRSDPVLGADYRSSEDFRREYAARLGKLGPLDSAQPTWAWFGNSFVQAPAMLAETAQVELPRIRMFYLGRNEPINLRVAQVRLLLENGLRPQRIVFVLLPIDVAVSGKQPLASILVTSHGAITYRVPTPGPPMDALLRVSRLATVAWVRSGQHVWDRSFRPGLVTRTLSPMLASDLHNFMSVLGDASRKSAVPITVLLIPNREQIFGTAGFALQDAVVGLCREERLDCFDARHVFGDDVDKTSLFLPDWHFTQRGNRLLLTRLLAHFDNRNAATSVAVP